MAQCNTSSLYSESYEHDSCGFGLIANMRGQASTWLVDQAFTALCKMSHRGGINADGITGDGCGILLYRPEAWLRALAREAGIAVGGRFAAGVVFLDRDPAHAATSQDTLERCLRDEGALPLGWRDVPVEDVPCGPLGTASRPLIRQIFVGAGANAHDEAAFERVLFRARRRAELALAGDASFYVTSLSAATIVYKAMAAPGRLRDVFPDLRRPDLAASAATFHQRFSTNTLPNWRLAQPFRLLAHNGEINTIRANRTWTAARTTKLISPLVDFSDLGALVSADGSDSQSLDNMLEVLLAGGIDLLAAMRILIPPAWGAQENIDEDLEAFYEYYALHTEPWDGPAGLVMCDGRYAACAVDRNGLRPARGAHSDDDHLIIASETGLWNMPDDRIIAKGRLGPGQMLAVDLAEHRLIDSAAIDAINRARAPFKRWLRDGVTYLESHLIDPGLAAEPFAPDVLARFQKQFALTGEERDVVLKTLAEDEAEATGSMGDDTPIAVLSRQSRPLYEYFRQAFAQVTNPPIDPLRERLVMSLVTQIGREGNVFDLSPDNAKQVLLTSPVLSQRKLRQILALPTYADKRKFDLYFDEHVGLQAAIEQLCTRAEQAVRDGAVVLLLSDRYPVPGLLPIHALLATGAVHAHLLQKQLRCDCNILVETGTMRDAHHCACLIGFGATAVYPYLAYQTLYDMNRRSELKGRQGEAPHEIGRSYRRGVRKGLLKILSKMGISTIAGYRGAGLFEILGLDREVVDLCFPGTPSRIGGAGFADIEAEYRAQLAAARDPNYALPPGGLMKAIPGGEFHMVNPEVVGALQTAVRTGDVAQYRQYANAVNTRAPAALRDLLALTDKCTAIALGDVEPAGEILKRFDSAGMSLGALSPEAHEALAIAMNRLGARSNSGEGGEDPARYGSERMSKIKQVASGRFGVTPAYLVNAEVLQIKIAQGAKPGEGGQLPGHKVTALIARLRYAKPGIGLISPPPHHDIYSIEDLAQLIHDLREVNPTALISVKLVAHAGVGTIAAGVVKAGADLITVSGHDGGTGASPWSSIRYAGVPWELGLTETHQTLVRNGLRKRVLLQTDGGLKTGLDVIKAAILGADSFGFGTAPMVALGCKYLRICHLNSCATGVATQNEILRRKHFLGAPEMAEKFFRFVADDVREILAMLGARTLGEIVGNTDLLRQIEGVTAKQRRVDLAPLLHRSALAGAATACAAPAPASADDLAARIAADTAGCVSECTSGTFHYAIDNTDRATGARLAGEIARRYGDAGMCEQALTLHFNGSAGQSFGAWNAPGMRLVLHGEANDGVGKGMAGGRIVVRPPAGTRRATQETSIVGNTCLYGATGGEFFGAGCAGERFGVRNSGALAVIEGVGDHGCEYMTGGTVVVLGRSGLNFGAGMTGGFAYVLDQERDFVDRYNHELIDIHRISLEGMENHLQHLRQLLRSHCEATASVWAQNLLADFRDVLHKIWLVKPKAASLEALTDELRRAA